MTEVGQNLLILKSNKTFLSLYHNYIRNEWRRHYISYDALKLAYKRIKNIKSDDWLQFEKDFSDEIKRVDVFLKETTKSLQVDLITVSESCDFFLSRTSESVKKQKELGKSVEISIRRLFQKCKDCEQFFKLNKFVIIKLSKKLEKLMVTNSNGNNVEMWCDRPSSIYFTNKFLNRIIEIEKLTDNATNLYSNYFRQKYPELTIGELEFVKNKEREHQQTKVYFGFKLGIIVCLVSSTVC